MLNASGSKLPDLRAIMVPGDASEFIMLLLLLMYLSLQWPLEIFQELLLILRDVLIFPI